LPFWMENLMNWMNSWKFGWLGKKGFFFMFELRGLKWFELWKGNLHISDFLPLSLSKFCTRQTSDFSGGCPPSTFGSWWRLDLSRRRSLGHKIVKNPWNLIETCEWNSKSHRILTRLIQAI
jgi:hypothetical protein